MHGPGAGSGAWEGGARVQLGEISLNFPPRWHGPATGVPCGGWARRLGIDHVRARRSQVIIFFILFSYIQFVTQKMFMTLDGCEQIFARMESGNSAISICQWKKKKIHLCLEPRTCCTCTVVSPRFSSILIWSYGSESQS